MKCDVRAIEFSGSTYQVEVWDEELQELFWPFLQFDDKGGVKDAFCSCEGEEEQCGHLKAAVEAATKGEAPLHVRFQRSFWRHLTQIEAERSEYKGKLEGVQGLKKGAKERLQEWRERKGKLTPENSIKFSGLSQEEINRWREGRPSPFLAYELSVWSDLGKWLFLKQEKGLPYTLAFEEDAEGLPTRVAAKWDELQLTFSLTREELVALIPSLETVNSPLKVESGGAGQIEKVTFDAHTGAFSMQRKGRGKGELGGEKRIVDGWTYVSGKGFFASAGKEALEGDQTVEELLDAEHEQIAAHAEGFSVDPHPHPLAYTLRFDQEWRWHIVAYLFQEGDIHTLFGKWAYVTGKGFFRVTGALFPTVERVLEEEEVSPFVSGHRIWLNTQEGFTTHLASVETTLTYEVTAKGDLLFKTKPLETGETKDFVDWVYYKGEGFFSKQESRNQGAIRAGLRVPARDVPLFLRTHQEDLEGVANFFLKALPIKQRGVRIVVEDDSGLRIVPAWEPETVRARFFGDYVYVNGFFELPPSLRLSSAFDTERRVRPTELVHFFKEEWPRLERMVIDCDPQLKVPHKLELTAHYLARNPEGGLKARLFYHTEHGRIPFTALLQAVDEKQRFLFTDGGRLDLQEERLQWLSQLSIPYNSDNETLELSTLDFLRIDSAEEMRGPPEGAPAAEICRQLLHDLREFRISEQADLTGLKSELRLYQQTGLKWLWFLYKNGLSGLLCDEMGLGKTHQAMALMAAALNQKGSGGRKFLVVCPTSVIYHWEDKLATFLPHFKVHTFHGLKRSLKRLPKEGVILTSYGILRLETEALKKLHFDIAVFDEIQVAKNARSRVHKALTNLDAGMSLGLTGTPIENNLLELKSLFDVVLPGYFPGEKRYRELFANPIEREGDEEKRALLSKTIHPFILRRRKIEVLDELPEKSEDKTYCELSEEQKTLYREALSANRDELIAELRDREAKVSYMHIFSILSKLKQICDHPALIAKEPAHYKNYASGKWDLFVELMEETRESEQKVVVFSQYLYMLDIIELFLKEQGWRYAQIRGDTVDRREQLKKFQEDPSCTVFIGSLQAAGLGIDLTAASTVILYDRWWNAARENQAIDRVHRIGQKWGVQVYKLITKGTIEEKIDRLITKKGRMMEEVVTADDQAALKKFSRSDLIDFLSLSE